MSTFLISVEFWYVYFGGAAKREKLMQLHTAPLLLNSPVQWRINFLCSFCPFLFLLFTSQHRFLNCGLQHRCLNLISIIVFSTLLPCALRRFKAFKKLKLITEGLNQWPLLRQNYSAKIFPLIISINSNIFNWKKKLFFTIVLGYSWD